MQGREEELKQVEADKTELQGDLIKVKYTEVFESSNILLINNIYNEPKWNSTNREHITYNMASHILTSCNFVVLI